MEEYREIFPFWDRLTPEEESLIRRSMVIERYEKGQLMHCAQESCKGLMALRTGRLRTYILSEEGREVTLFRVQAPELCVLSASCLMESIQFDVLIEAVETTEVLLIPAVALKTVLRKNPLVELYLYKAAAEKFSDVMWTLQEILFRKVDQRIARFLRDESLRTGSPTLTMTHEEIAREIGSAREVVTKVLKYMASEQVVELMRGKIRIRDKEKLKKYL